MPIQRIPYPIGQAVAVLKDIDLLVLVGAVEPVAFFAYPGRPSRLVPPGCEVLTLAAPTDDVAAALAALAEELGAPPAPIATVAPPEAIAPTGPLTDDALTRMIAALLPDNAIIAEEALTSVRGLFDLTHGAPPHDYLLVPGGAIGNGIPMAIGAAIACPDRKVLNLQADGSGMVHGCRASGRRRASGSTCSPSSSPTAPTPSCAPKWPISASTASAATPAR